MRASVPTIRILIPFERARPVANTDIAIGGQTFYLARPCQRQNLSPDREKMALIIQKHGGTSVGNTERIKNVAARVAKYRQRKAT